MYLAKKYKFNYFLWSENCKKKKKITKIFEQFPWNAVACPISEVLWMEMSENSCYLVVFSTQCPVSFI